MTNRKELEANSKRISGAITTGIVGLLLVCLFLFGFSLPALNEEPEGLLVDFGTDLTGFGLDEPDIAASGGVVAKQEVEQETITQDVEESIVIKDKKEVTKPKVNPVSTTTTTKTTTNTQVNQDELFDLNKLNKKGTSGSSEGTSTKGGNQGDPNGDPNGYQGKGSGFGDDGSVGWSLNGRKLMSPAILSVDHNEVGDIKIKITVDRNGKVIKADYERNGSDITNTYLVGQAKTAAMRASFNVDQNAQQTQIGYITFHFKLQ